MHYYQHHIGDFLRDAGSLPNEALGAYMRLLWRYYADEAPIQGEPEDIAFDLSTSAETVRQLLRRYFHKTDDGWRHTRCDREIEQYRQKAEKAAASANARWKNARAMRSHSGRTADEPLSDANQEPITNNQQKEQKKKQAARSAPHPPKPEGVSDETWDAWLDLRKKKRAPVSAKVLTEAAAEAAKAGLTLDRFLTIWVFRGSQGLQADWLKPHERAGPARPDGKPSAAADFRSTNYTGTPYDELPPDLR